MSDADDSSSSSNIDTNDNNDKNKKIWYSLEEFSKLKLLLDNWKEIAEELATIGVVELDIDRPKSVWGEGLFNIM
jgi:hypothetical protein